MSRPTICFRSARSEDAKSLAIRLRSQDLDELRASVSSSAEQALLAGIEEAIWSKAAVVDGEVAALFGVTPLTKEGAAQPRIGVPWMLASDAIYSVGPLRFCRAARFWLGEMHNECEILVNVVMASNTIPIQWLDWLGFRFTALHARYGPGKVPFMQFESHSDREETLCATPS